MKEIIFVVEESPEGGFTARSLGASIFTEGDDIDDLKKNIREAVKCHFNDRETSPKVIRLHLLREEVLAI